MIKKSTDNEGLKCQICNAENHSFVIKGNDTCYYCGNEIRVCTKCLEKMITAVFPVHKTGMIIEHNEYKTNYESIEEAVENIDEDDWVSQEEKRKSIETGEIWYIQWYPDTPVSFRRAVASTLTAALGLNVNLQSTSDTPA